MIASTTTNQDNKSARRGLLHFIDELRRRRVCRAITLYSVATWLIVQVLDVLETPLNLPEWTIRFVVVISLLGLPIALIISWLVDLTPQGFVIDNGPSPGTSRRREAPRKPFDRLIDSCLLLAALVIGVQLATGKLFFESHASTVPENRIVVEPFNVAAIAGDPKLSATLLFELQHALRSRPGVSVIAEEAASGSEDTRRIDGAITVDESRVRVTATLVDGETGEIVWSDVFERANTGIDVWPDLASDIASALPVRVAIAEYDHGQG